MRITKEMIARLGLSMLEIGFTIEDIETALNAIMPRYALEIIANLKLKTRD